jgi:hypothetical protein
MGLRRSWPDFLLIHAGLIYGMELKRVGGQLSRTRTVRTRRGSLRILEGQFEVFPRLEAAGMQPIEVCYSIEDVVAAWERWGIPLRGRLVGPGTRSRQPIIGARAR